MKKFVLIFILTVCIGLKASAQFYFGPQAGLNIATLKGTDLSVSSKPGFHGGIYFNIPLTTHISVMPAVLYSMKGFEYDLTTTSTSSEPDTSGGTITSTLNFTANVNSTLGYIDIPLLFTIWTGEQKGLFIQAGPQLSFLITDKATINTSSTVSVNGGTSQPTTPSTENDLSFHKTDLALIGGIGYKFPKLLILYVRASTGFLEVQEGTFIENDDAGNNFVFEAGIGLSLGAK